MYKDNYLPTAAEALSLYKQYSEDEINKEIARVITPMINKAIKSNSTRALLNREDAIQNDLVYTEWEDYFDTNSVICQKLKDLGYRLSTSLYSDTIKVVKRLIIDFGET